RILMKYKVFSSIISLIITSLLLICIVNAWYVSNKEATANGITGVTAIGNIWDIKLNRYIAVENNDNTYKKEAINDDGSNLLPYDILNDYSKLIYEISFKTTLNTINISVGNNGYRNNNFIEINYKNYNYLSNVAIFKVLKHENNIFSIVNNNEYYLPYSEEEDNTIHNTLIDTINTTDENVTIYLLFDYNTNNINRLFTDNIGESSLDTIVYFKDDLMFYLRG
ncbi:MAG: hypothetical protein ACI35S_01670, partial [Anaeroplasma sp.]